MQNIEQNNILIAEFMGWKPSVLGGGINLYYLPNHEDGTYNSACYQISAGSMKYDTSWGMLMPVVEKIESLKYVDEFNINWESVSGRQYVRILPAFNNTFDVIFTSDVNKMVAIYKGVVNFINWYNKINNIVMTHPKIIIYTVNGEIRAVHSNCDIEYVVVDEWNFIEGTEIEVGQINYPDSVDDKLDLSDAKKYI